MFKPRAGQISHTLPTTRHCCNLGVWALAQSRGDGHRSLVTPERQRALSENNKDLILSPIFCENLAIAKRTASHKFAYHQNIALNLMKL